MITKKKIIFSLTLIMIVAAFSIQVTRADQPTPQPVPPSPTRKTESVRVENGETIQTITVEIDVRQANLGLLDGVSPDASVPGPGGQSGVLSALLEYKSATLPPWRARGGSKIVLTGSPTAKAWPIFSIGGAQMEDGTSSPCWTTTSCTKWTVNGSQYGWYNANNGQTAITFAQTTVYWSSGSSTTANATATKTF